ncbi:uncharacterized protein LOC123016452 [Tribolium madens]|uniref:uncharacterized protein LOC123016452 n=1 Tax=Tribolium madens TaxID=41895 RepID=UPI001CF728F4|nr:uncharacterized protein LOC123016452 [Tribolium madens]XP_044272798.1 uncharacterized protein LOC123016452 [Tribolium madens]
MRKPQTDEQFPLLLVLMGNEDVAQNNKRLFRGRLDGITSGASAIITEWPNYLSSCWLTALICGITLFIASIMLTSCMTYEHHLRYPRCSSEYQLIDNRTIHLVHTSHKWHLNQLRTLENIVKAFPDYQIHLLIVGSKTHQYIKLKRAINNETKTNETKIIHQNKTEFTIDDLVQKYPHILVSQLSYGDIFSNSPLYFSWIRLSPQMKLFAIRVLQIWQFGGLSFDIPDKVANKRCKNYTSLLEMKIRLFVRYGKKRYEKLGQDVVSVDSNGLHMESKTPCHAFFGKVLTNLRKASQKATPRMVLTGPIYAFCKAGVVDEEFCPKNPLI